MTKKEQTEQQKANAAAKLAIAMESAKSAAAKLAIATEASASGVKKSIKTKAKAAQPVKKKPIKAKAKAKVTAKKEPVVDEKQIAAEIAKAKVSPTATAVKSSFFKKLKFW